MRCVNTDGGNNSFSEEKRKPRIFFQKMRSTKEGHTFMITFFETNIYFFVLATLS